MIKNKLDIAENPFFIKYAQTALGKIFIIAIFTLLISIIPLYPIPWQQTIFITIVMISFKPQYRHLCLFVSVLCLLLQGLSNKFQPDWQLFRINYLYLLFENDYLPDFTLIHIKYIDLLIMLLCSETLIFMVRRFRQYTLFQYPITISYLAIFVLMLIAVYAPFTAIQRYLFWSFIILYTHYFWFIGYTLLEAKLGTPRNYLLDYGRYLPVWGFNALPYGKGSIYLQKVESHTPADFAVTQLKAIKLGFWALILHFLMDGMAEMQQQFQIPTLSERNHAI
jgi:hypothetical protein